MEITAPIALPISSPSQETPIPTNCGHCQAAGTSGLVPPAEFTQRNGVLRRTSLRDTHVANTQCESRRQLTLASSILAVGLGCSRRKSRTGKNFSSLDQGNKRRHATTGTNLVGSNGNVDTCFADQRFLRKYTPSFPNRAIHLAMAELGGQCTNMRMDMARSQVSYSSRTAHSHSLPTEVVTVPKSIVTRIRASDNWCITIGRRTSR